MTTKIEELTGRPIEGEIRPTASDIPPQKDPQELIAVLDELLAHPGVISYKWSQYTPYWNDGEPCEFGTLTDWKAGVKLEFGDEEGGDFGDGFYTSYDVRRDIQGVDTTELLAKLQKVERAIGSSSHEVWLKDTFGDHASVIATKDGFEVEYFEHD